jgi:hypothetical protein
VFNGTTPKNNGFGHGAKIQQMTWFASKKAEALVIVTGWEPRSTSAR